MPEFKVGIADFSVFFFEGVSRRVSDAVPFGAAALRVDDSDRFGPKCFFFPAGRVRKRGARTV